MSIRIESGRKAKLDGHKKEDVLSKMLTEKTGKFHTDEGVGGNNTKVDIICEELLKYISQKSCSGKNTQVHLTSTKIWCEYFKINEDLRLWFDQFFGLPRSGRDGRLEKSEISDELNQLALDWFNDNKMSVFDVIVRHGAYKKKGGQIERGNAITHMIWYNKETNQIDKEVTVEYLANLVRGGKWIMRETTLHFIDGNGNKRFHLQMKGSGDLSQKNSMQFHIYKVC
tara:strand:+ start:13 stop:693 length:681 start_codon:yes stop_codon:yes gene_type:complete